jgi:hypothetical protein
MEKIEMLVMSVIASQHCFVLQEGSQAQKLP